jgi:hypothetical protein
MVGNHRGWTSGYRDRRRRRPAIARLSFSYTSDEALPATRWNGTGRARNGRRMPDPAGFPTRRESGTPHSIRGAASRATRIPAPRWGPIAKTSSCLAG